MITARILLLEENLHDAQTIIGYLTPALGCDCEIDYVDQLAVGLGQLAKCSYDLVLFSLGLQSDRDGAAGVRLIHDRCPDVPVGVLSTSDDIPRLTEALAAGAQNYFIKGQTDPVLWPYLLQKTIDQHHEHQALQASEARFRNMITSNADGIVLVDDEGIVIFVNPAAEALFGLSADQLQGTAYGSPVVVGEKVEIDIPRSDGETVIAEMRVERTNWEGRPVRLASLRDISDRKQLEASLMRTTTHLSNVLGSISDGFFTLDQAMRITYFNPAAEQLLGRKRQEVLGKHIFDEAFPEAKGSQFDEYYSYALRYKATTTFETYFGVAPYANWYDVRVYPFADGIAVYFRVITERKVAERSLRESEDRYRRLVDLAPEAILVHVDRKVAYINSAGVKLFGAKTPDDLIGTHISQLIHPDYRAFVARRVEHIVEHEQPAAFAEQKLVRLNGTTFDAEVAGTPVTYLGQPAGQTIIRDITARKQLDADLRQHRDNLEELVEERAAQIVAMNEQLKIEIAERKRSEEALRFTQFSVDNSSDAAFWMDSQSRFVYVNTAACELLGYSREELLTMRVPDVDADFTDAQWPAHWEEIKTRGSFMFESRHLTKDDRIIPVEVTVNYLEYDGREYNCAFARDITLRKQAEEAYHTLIDYSVQGFSINQRGRIVFANEAFAQMSGYSVDELLDMTPEQVVNMVYPDDHERVLSSYRKRETGELGPERYEYRMIRKDGEVWWLEIYAIPVTFQGQPAVQASFIDITERKRSEEAQRLAHQRLRQLDTMKSEFIASVSHELRTPVTNLKLYQHLMERQPEKTAAYLDKLGAAIRRLEAIVEEILFVSDFDQIPQLPELASLDLNVLAADAIASWGTAATQKNLTLTLTADPQLSLVSGDSALMMRVIDVLIDNAIKYTPSDGTIDVKTSMATVGDQTWGRVHVQDSGVGLAEGEHQRIFDRFYRGHAARQTTTPGAGLGLAIAQVLVNRQYGRIEAANRDDGRPGALFTVWLPLVGDD